jgi:hypothetical protein
MPKRRRANGIIGLQWHKFNFQETGILAETARKRVEIGLQAGSRAGI